MLSALASVFLLGIVPAEPPPPPPRTLPGIEVLDVAAPSSLASRFTAPALSASGAILVDALSGEEIFSVSPDERRPMASLTKIMTALLVLEHRSLGETVTVAPIADNIGGSTINLTAGEHFTVGSLMKALLLHSANDAAYALAVFDARSVGGFVKTMNERAAALGLRNTHFANPAGLDSEQQYSTPRDLVWLTMAALKHEAFRDIVGTRNARIVSFEDRMIDLKNTNELLHYNQSVFGVKTGTTDRAGECLIVLFHEDDHPYILVLLGSKERYTDSLRVLKAVHDAA
jgi:serine-type D-Ala-D-Ala carboxypeptidase (penicillin-binding protein 5/6)